MSSLRRGRLGVVLLAALALSLALASSSQAASGTWERAWGLNVNGGGVFGVCTVASSCLSGDSGELGGELNIPLGIAVDGSGNVYVADTGNRRIQKFDSSGTWERAWGRNVVKDGGAGAVCTDAQAGSSPGTVCFEVCTVAADCQAGAPGFRGGEMSDPEGVAADGAGNVYVGDSGNNRIQKFDSSGAFLRAWGKNVNGGGIFGICVVASNCQAGMAGGLGGEMSNPQGVVADGAGNVYVTDVSNTRIQKFDSAGVFLRTWGKSVNGGFGFEVCTAPADCQAGGIGMLGGEMSDPVGIAADGSGNVYVADESNHRIQKFDSAGVFLGTWGKSVNGGGGFEVCTPPAFCQAGGIGTLGGEMSGPVGVAADGAGNVYVSDFQDSRIQKFDSLGTWQRAWGLNVNGGGVFEVCTVASSCLAGNPGSLGGEMDSPNNNSIASDSSGNVYVSDTNNNRVQRFADPLPPVTPPTPTPTPAQPSIAGTCIGRPATITGTEGSDQLSGTSGPDVIAALGGNDKVSGLRGNDLVCGGPGNDTLKGGPGNDKLYGSSGKDFLKGGDGHDHLVGGPGNDTLDYK